MHFDEVTSNCTSIAMMQQLSRRLRKSNLMIKGDVTTKSFCLAQKLFSSSRASAIPHSYISIAIVQNYAIVGKKAASAPRLCNAQYSASNCFGELAVAATTLPLKISNRSNNTHLLCGIVQSDLCTCVCVFAFMSVEAFNTVIGFIGT